MEDDKRLLCVASEDKARSNGLKSQQGRRRLVSGRISHCEGSHRDNLPREVVESPSLQVLKSRLNKGLAGMVLSGLILSTTENGLDDIQNPFLLFYDTKFWSH